jgi:hypothetical protein
MKQKTQNDSKRQVEEDNTMSFVNSEVIKGMNLAVRRLSEPEDEETDDGRRNPHKHTYFIPFYDAVWVARSIDTIPPEYLILLRK